MNTQKVVSLFIVVCLLIGSSALSGQTPQSQWKLVDIGPFTINVPQGWVYNKLQGVDSFVGEFVGGGIKLSFDYGWYSDKLNDRKSPEYVVSDDVIDGQKCRIVHPKNTGNGLVGINFPDTDPNTKNVGLTITTRDLNRQQLSLALKIFETIKFK